MQCVEVLLSSSRANKLQAFKVLLVFSSTSNEGMLKAFQQAGLVTSNAVARQ